MQRNLFLLLFCFLLPPFLFAQQGDSALQSGKNIPDTELNNRDTANGIQKIRQTVSGSATDTSQSKTDSIRNAALQSISPLIKNPTERAINHLKWINQNATPVYFVSEERNVEGKEGFFYAFCGFLFLLGLFKTFYQNYFSNLFRVYFNTSLRQSQLSEQLLQARLPNLIMNIFFVISGGVFLWQLFSSNFKIKVEPQFFLQMCIAAVAFIYLVKFIFLKFIGWISGRSQDTDHYIFIIFLLNKLLGLLLIPFIILIEFGKPEWFPVIRILALLTIAALILTRYFQSYGIIGQRLTIRPFHFLVYVIGAEILPLALLYKASVDYFIR